jgi:hypothetical protein
MNVNNGRQIVLAARPGRKPQLSDFPLGEVRVPTPSSGHVLPGVLHAPKTDFPGAQKHEYLLHRETDRSHRILVPRAIGSRLECREF